MKRTFKLFLIMVFGAMMIDSEGWAFVAALAMVLVPAVLLIVGELKENKVNANIDENTLVDYATRSDMVEFV